ncbi:TIGR04063 family PEP-CTERM/XrtA system glycosyltransferase [Zooshikella ganghwensis]|uniref:Glycosyltransferase, exosortase A system-associated n=1 Tax=Zooshikella ganghwensis TaxID=202772 RepID=A0A4P9VSC0_9GAMM|nr:TIGR04063 family PEP-CTERM/XrtA system glycosyltransferase [Zooshikella ganghwensis]RDH44900.1 glycosyltransferase, exosortase A system-associated [Zooshikella ganghwensis]
MKVLHILDHSIPLHSGYTFRTRAILQQQQKLGWQTYQLTSPKQGVTPQLCETVDDLVFYRTPPLASWLQAIPVVNQLAIIPVLAKRIVQVAKEIKPDLIHAHSPAINGMAAYLAAKKLKLPLVYEVRAFWEDAAVDHGTAQQGDLRYRLTRKLETMVLKRAHAITTICQGLKSEMLTRDAVIQDITVIPNAVDIERFQPQDQKDAELLASLGLEGRLVIGFIGSFYAYEGLDLLIEAMPGLIEKMPNACLLLVGGGPEDERLKQLAKQSPVADQIIMTGRVPHDQVHRYYSTVDILAYPRKPMRLTELVTPLKPLEAMAQHKLVVASDVGGHKELIRHGENGLLFRQGDVSDLIVQIEQLAGDSQLQQQLLHSGRKYVEHERNWKKSVSHYQDVYQRAIAKVSGQSATVS